jgi:hypothetical protein
VYHWPSPGHRNDRAAASVGERRPGVAGFTTAGV